MSEPEPGPKGWKSLIIYEMKEYFFNFVFLAFYFVSFASYRRLILAGSPEEILGWWAPLIEAAVLAKVVMIGDALHLGRRLNHHYLLISAFYRTFVFGLFAGCCKILETYVAGNFHHESWTTSLHHLTSQGWPEILGSSLIVVVAFLPFFTYKELESVIGAGRLRGILFGAKVPEGDLVAK